MSLVDISGVTLSSGRIPINGPVDISGITVVTDPSTGVKNLPVTVRDYTVLSFTRQSVYDSIYAGGWKNTYTTWNYQGEILVDVGCYLKTLFLSNANSTATAFVSIYDRNTSLGIIDTATRDAIAPTFLFIIFYPQTKHLHLNHRFNNGIVMVVQSAFSHPASSTFLGGVGSSGFNATGTYTLL